MAAVTHHYLSVPATLMQPERLFSATGNVNMKLRSRLLPQTAELLVFLNKNISPIRPWRRPTVYFLANREAWQFASPASRGGDRPSNFPGRVPFSPLPGRPCIISGTSLPIMSTDRPKAAINPPTPAIQLQSVCTVKGTYSGKIESLDRDPGIATIDPGMQFPEELTSLQ